MKSNNPIEQVRLAFACDKQWGAMTPCGSGKHCSACNKTVIDFTEKSLEELHAALLREGSVCGRFRASQLAAEQPKPKRSFVRVAASVLLAIGFSALGKSLQAQDISSDSLTIRQEEDLAEMPFGVVMETLPVYKFGGEQGMLDFIRNNLKYPAQESANGIFVATFVIDTLGNVTESQVVKSVSAAADKEALRVVRLLEFVPGIQGGRKVPVRYTLPIRFSDDSRKEK